MFLTHIHTHEDNAQWLSPVPINAIAGWARSGAALMLIGDLCLSVIPASPGDSGLFLRQAFLNGSYPAWRLPLLLVTGLAGMALAFFSVRVCYMQIKPQYRKTRLTVLIGGVIYIATAAARNVLLSPARVADRFHDPSRYSPGSGRNGLCLGFRAETGFGQCGAADLDAGQRPLGAAANSIMTSPWLKRIPPCAAA